VIPEAMGNRRRLRNFRNWLVKEAGKDR